MEWDQATVRPCHITVKGIDVASFSLLAKRWSNQSSCQFDRANASSRNRARSVPHRHLVAEAQHCILVICLLHAVVYAHTTSIGTTGTLPGNFEGCYAGRYSPNGRSHSTVRSRTTKYASWSPHGRLLHPQPQAPCSQGYISSAAQCLDNDTLCRRRLRRMCQSSPMEEPIPVMEKQLQGVAPPPAHREVCATSCLDPSLLLKRTQPLQGHVNKPNTRSSVASSNRSSSQCR